MNRLQNKVAIVTGSARGIGAETARTFAAEGAKVVITDVMAEQGEATAAAIREAGGDALFVQANVAELSSVQKLVDATVAHYGRLDIIVNNAGVLRDAQLKKMSEKDFDLVIAVNLKGVYNCGQVAANQMLAQGEGGVILNASSVVGMDGNFGQTNYVATKAGVIGMTKVWARELGPKGIRVNAVAPGIIETDMTAQMPQHVYDGMVAKTPLRRAGTAQDIANAYLWLASDEANFISGVTLRVDGGILVGT
ncbi:MAG: glucose 1-dehydrogenase [Caldilineaceae bacterium]|nr:glucose 1-dehydrogenase [Caldilineaceae bacterium]MBP8106652.1 glucose 1-dehydrogenase [Caldilineaceae bacterium]MBP8122208.1 glucose 1-dehydrogenase [Caldilineaceae bacterium]MBP9071703.1 glucose 1-dehydrogenase [Caldilineaceae bacterium]